MWTLILFFVVYKNGAAFGVVNRLPTEAACIATGQAMQAQEGSIKFHCAKVGRQGASK